MQNIWFTSDLHFSHKNILKHCPNRIEAGGFKENEIGKHDEWLINKWNTTIGKHDIVYVLGDFAFGSPDNVRKLLSRLHGDKFLILGNHDKSSKHLDGGYFKQVTQMKYSVFKKTVYSFLEEDFHVFMCHYPMISWDCKHYGCVECHGHCHGRLDDYNDSSTDLRVDIGIDGKLANYEFISLEQLYKYFKEKTKGLTFLEYTQKMKEENNMIF